MTKPRPLADVVRDFLDDTGITKEAFIRRADVSKSTLLNLLNGRGISTEMEDKIRLGLARVIVDVNAYADDAEVDDATLARVARRRRRQ